MGYFRHDVSVLEFDRSNPDAWADLVTWRERLPDEWKALVVGPVHAITNGYVWFVMLPDGSKEGWDDSNKGDEYRQEFENRGDLMIRARFGDSGPGISGGWRWDWDSF